MENSLIRTIVEWIKIAKNVGLSYKMMFILMALSLISTVTEIFAIGMFLPIIQFIRLEGDLTALSEDSDLWQYIIDWFSYFNFEPSLIVLLLVSFSFLLGRQLATYIRIVFNAAVRYKLSQIRRNNIFNRYLKANTSYHDSTPVGDLSNIINVEVTKAISGLLVPMELAVYMVMLTTYAITLFALSWEVTLASLSVILLAIQIPKIWIKKTRIVGRRLVNANIMMSTFLINRLRSPSLIRLSGTEDAENNAFDVLTHVQRKHSVTVSILKAKTDFVIEPVVAGLSFIFLYFSYNVLQLQIEIVAVYLVILMRLMPTVKALVSKWQSVQSLVGSIEVIEIRLKAMCESKEQDTGVELCSGLKDSISINNVSFRYLTEKTDILKNITIEINANKITALVGPSGGGKSTFIELLPRIRLPIEGMIKFDGKDINKYTLKSLRQIISYVPQFPHIFDGTVKEHILYGKSGATDEEVQEAARLAGAEEFINQLPQGFDTILGEDAIRVSGGQRQRLDLARALIKKTSILIMDEPTSNLDAESEDLFKKSLDKIHKETKITIIIVTHRLAGVKNADKIIVLNKGKVEAVGRHAELLKQNGWYAKAWKE
jgi:ABC-type multidrug transport system fused ATPase/permease subunit